MYHQLADVQSIACTGNVVAYSRTCTVTSNALSVDLRFPGGTYALDPDACQTVTVTNSYLEASDIVMLRWKKSRNNEYSRGTRCCCRYIEHRVIHDVRVQR